MEPAEERRLRLPRTMIGSDGLGLATGGPLPGDAHIHGTTAPAPDESWDSTTWRPASL